ncbi:MAG TPA: SGNH/GDSL hydrolase family protein [Chitinophagaceae bacterium]|nr:SGNH/GDSL hydrolase family protein [Chitinophagaceae bacterium]
MPFAKVKKKIVYGCFLVIFTCLAAEVLLRIYNPFATSVTGDRITLHTNTEVVVTNGANSLGLDESVTVKKNSLGFRGPEPPANFNEHLTIVTVGGSTTECLFVPEAKTWPALLAQQLQSSFNNTWVNNAGLNGHSTYGHIKLMEEYIQQLQPDCCLFLVGCNDVDRPDLTPSDSTIDNNHQKWILKLANNSRLANVLLNFYRHNLASKRELTNNIHFSLRGKQPRVLSDSVILQQAAQRKALVQQYGARLKRLIDICRRSTIEPVFITQPCLLGDTTDDLTGIDMGSFPFNQGNGKLAWTILQLYNEETKKICQQNNVMVIDLAAQVPKSTRYFYDVYHFNNEGCQKISTLLFDGLATHLAKKFPSHVKN